MREPGADLKEAIAHAYRVFPARALKPPIGVCRCNVCVSEEDERAMAQTPRDALPARLIREFNGSAHGRDDDLLRHFLPRIFELFAEGSDIHALGDINAFERLGCGTALVPYSDYRKTWPAEEIAAVDAYYRALFRHARRAPPTWPEGQGCEAFVMAEIIVAGGGDLKPLLAEWDADPSHEATLGLASFTAHVADHIWRRCGRMVDVTLGGYWDRQPEMTQALLDWLRDARRVDRFDQAMAREADESAFALLALARGGFAA